MGKGGYNGGSTVIGPGSGWFGGKRKIKPSDLGKGDLSPSTGIHSALERQAAVRLKANAIEARRKVAKADADKAKAIGVIRRARRAEEELARKTRKAAAKAARAPLRKARRMVERAISGSNLLPPENVPSGPIDNLNHQRRRVRGKSFVVIRPDKGRPVLMEIDPVTHHAKGASRAHSTKSKPDDSP